MKRIFSVTASAAIAAGLLIAPASVNAAPTISAPATAVVATPAKAKPKAKKAKVSVKISVSDKEPYVGQKVTLKATVKKNGKAVKGTTVTFKKLHSMEGSTSVLGKAKTNKQGVATFKRKVAKWDGGYTTSAAGKTARADVYSHANLSWSLPAKKTIYRGQKLSFNIKSPSFQGSAVYLQYEDAKEGWVGIGGFFNPGYSRDLSEYECPTNNCIIIGSKGTARGTLFPFDLKGKFKFRLVQEGIQVHDTSYSKPVTITVK